MFRRRFVLVEEGARCRDDVIKDCFGKAHYLSFRHYSTAVIDYLCAVCNDSVLESNDNFYNLSIRVSMHVFAWRTRG